MKKDHLPLCNNCPHQCNVTREADNMGFCNTDNKNTIASICVHKGEEPAISGKNGICNVFFFHCNMQCIYCQNYQISSNTVCTELFDDASAIKTIKKILDNGINLLGFVSPSHCIDQMQHIVRNLNADGYYPKIVYNSNGYDSVDMLVKIGPFIDVYLPDFKYADNAIALELSGVKDYKENAILALKEMYRQKGTLLLKNEDGQAESGMIVRHLVLPGYIENSIGVLQLLSEEFPAGLHISLMAQYYPTKKVLGHKNLGRKLHADEYQKVVNEMERLGFYKGWIQELQSSDYYNPDFELEHPFE